MRINISDLKLEQIRYIIENEFKNFDCSIEVIGDGLCYLVV
jgi:hypothetical protein